MEETLTKRQVTKNIKLSNRIQYPLLCRNFKKSPLCHKTWQHPPQCWSRHLEKQQQQQQCGLVLLQDYLSSITAWPCLSARLPIINETWPCLSKSVSIISDSMTWSLWKYTYHQWQHDLVSLQDYLLSMQHDLVSLKVYLSSVTAWPGLLARLPIVNETRPLSLCKCTYRQCQHDLVSSLWSMAVLTLLFSFNITI